MLNDKAKELIRKLDLPYPAIAVKYCYRAPENVEKEETVLSFCQFVRLAQDTGKHFYIDKDNDNCCGKFAVGMTERPASIAAGNIGPVLGVYRSAAPNARLHHSYPTMQVGSVNYVEFCPVEQCDFDPSLIMFVAKLEQADILLRATSYISGDLWESHVSCVMSCAWMYSYTYLTGKVNFTTTGLHHGMRTRHVYPAGLHMISVPYQKFEEFFTALDEEPWVLPALDPDPEVRARVQREMDAWGSNIIP